jgi:hypothetical protein
LKTCIPQPYCASAASRGIRHKLLQAAENVDVRAISYLDGTIFNSRKTVKSQLQNIGRRTAEISANLAFGLWIFFLKNV